MNSNRWLDWKPGAPIFLKRSGAKATKPSQPSSVGFDGAAPAQIQNIAPATTRQEDEDTSDTATSLTSFQRSFYSQLAQLRAATCGELADLARQRGIPRECAEAFWRSKERLKRGA